MNTKSATNIVVSSFIVMSFIVPSFAAAIDEVPALQSPALDIIHDRPLQDLRLDNSFVIAFGNSNTNKVVAPLNSAASECISVGDAYAASCAAAAFKKAAAAARAPDYRDARKELQKAAKKLERLVSKNQDRKQPTKKGRNGTYKAVKQEAIASVKREALKIIQETQTNLLRSSGSGARKVHYQRIAQAVGSTKVIFRS